MDPYSRRCDRSRRLDRVEDLVEGQSISETLDESTVIAKRVRHRLAFVGAVPDLRPAIVVKGKDGKVLSWPVVAMPGTCCRSTHSVGYTGAK